MKTNSVPKIRFKGFTDDWEQRKLGEVFEQTSNFVNPNEHDIELWSLTVEDGLTPKSERYSREFLVKKEGNFKEVRPGDIVYNPMNITLGAVGFNSMSKSVAVSGYYTTMIAKEENDAYYINTWLKSPKALFLYKTYATGSLIEKQRVQFPTLSIIPALFPSFAEQQKIGEYFSNLDNLITLHQRKCEQTKELKKFMLQKMFPKKGEKNPEIRFPGFTDDWEQRKVSDLLEERNEQAPETEDYPLMAFIANEGVAPKGERYDRGALVKDAKNKNYKKTELGDFIYSSNNLETGSIGLNNYGNASISPVYSIFKPTGIADSDFIGRRFVRKDFINAMVKWRQGVVYGQWKIHESDFLKIEVAVPSLGEQRKIGSYLNNLDNLITLHQRKCEQLKELKKFMLQNMFPKKG